ncbi:MAG TPA: hypothetical protein VH309_07660, partial [Elusimicrobiota bacterium]|nr:hypothetical protein [Elusimicrobiota bacterium]
KTSDRMILAAAALLACAAFSGPAAADDAAQTQPGAPAASPAAAPMDAQAAISSWPDKTKSAARAMIDKYGPPQVVTDKLLAWNDKDPWTMVGVYRDAVPHEQPLPHDDFIVNKIDYAVPADKVAALAHFDPDLVIDQARGTLAAHSDSEQHNTLALNLANEIVAGKRGVASARGFLKKTLEESMAGKSSPYTERLMFTPQANGAAPVEENAPTENPAAEPETQP